MKLTPFVVYLSIIMPSFGGECIQEGQVVPIYKNAPECCKGLSFKAPESPNVGFAGTCVEPTDRSPSHSSVDTEKPVKRITIFQQPSL